MLQALPADPLSTGALTLQLRIPVVGTCLSPIRPLGTSPSPSHSWLRWLSGTLALHSRHPQAGLSPLGPLAVGQGTGPAPL